MRLRLSGAFAISRKKTQPRKRAGASGRATSAARREEVTKPELDGAEPVALRVIESPPPPRTATELELSGFEARRYDLLWSAGVVGGIALLFVTLSYVAGVAVPVLLALSTAYVFNPIVTALEKKGVSRTLGTSIVFAAGALVLLGAVLYLIPVFRVEAAKLPEFLRRASIEIVPRIEALLGLSLPDYVRSRTSEIGSEASEMIQSAGPAVAQVLAGFAGNTARVVTMLLALSIVPVLAFFFLMDYPRLISLAKSLLPRRSLALVSRRFAQVDEVLAAFVRGQITVGAILSVMYASGLTMARIDLAIVIGVIAGFGNMVPYLGTALGIVLALLGVILSWHGPSQLLIVALTFVVAQMAEGFVITPRVVGDKVGLPPVVVILAVLAFGELFGFIGIFVAVPVAAVLKVVLTVVIERYRESRLYTGTLTKN